MKDQYFGDIGDYGKYGILRHLANAGIKVGVNWCLTTDDDSSDGGMTDYLENKADVFRSLDEGLFDVLKETVIDKDQRDVIASENLNLINNAMYFHELLDISKIANTEKRRAFRVEWHHRGLAALQDAELIYFDPDNGISKEKVSGRKNSVKYLLTCEAVDYYNNGHNIVYYCHKGRRSKEKWNEYKRILITGSPDSPLPADAELITLTYHRGVQRSFIFAIHPEDYEKYRMILDVFLNSSWGEHFEEELKTEIVSCCY